MVASGTPGRYCGLSDKFSSAEKSKIAILPVCFDATSSYRKGSDKGPMALIEASRYLEFYDIETNFEPHQMGIYTAEAVNRSTSQEMLSETYLQAKKFISEGKFLVTIGGEHSISQAPIRAHAEKYAPLSILQLDAHTDLHPALEDDPFSHGSVMARVREMPSISTIVSVGLRSMAIEELPYLDRKNCYFAHEIFDNDNWMESAIDSLSDNVYITFDLDAFDPSILPATGTPEPGGLGWYQILRFLKKVVAKKNVVGFDVVELCPLPPDTSSDFLAAKLIYKLLSYIFVKLRDGVNP